MAKKAEPDDIYKLFEIYRDYVKHEDNLINVRITWFLTTQAFLFSSYVILIRRQFENGQFVFSQSFQEILDLSRLNSANFLLVVICIFGLLLARRSYISIRAATLAVESLVMKWDTEIVPQYEESHLPGLTGGNSDKARAEGWASAATLPSFTRYLWIFIAIVHALLLRS